MEKEELNIRQDPGSIEIIKEESTPESRSRNWMKAKYPESNWENDDAYEESLYKHLEDTDLALSGYRQNDKTIGEILEMYPEFALVLQDIGSGVPLRIALERNIGLEELTPDEKDTEYEAFVEARDKRLADARKFNDEYTSRRANAEKSNELFSAFVEGQAEWDEAKKEGFVTFVQDFLFALGRGEFTNRDFQMLADAYTHDEDVAEAAETGKIEGRNETITTKRIKQKTEVDGIPDGGGANPAPAPSRPKRRSVINMAEALGISEEELEERRKNLS